MCFKLYTTYTVCDNKHLASLAFSSSHNLTALLGHKVLSQFYQCEVRMTSEELLEIFISTSEIRIWPAQFSSWKNLDIS